MHYQQIIAQPRYEDFEISSHDSNMWKHLGMGWTVEGRLGAGKADCSPYLNLQNIDPKWFAAVGGDEEKLREQVRESRA